MAEGRGYGLSACAGVAVGLALLLVVAAGPAAAQTASVSISGTSPSPLTRANLNGATIHMQMSGVDASERSAIFPSGCGLSAQWNLFEGHSISNRHLLTGEPSGVSVRVSAPPAHMVDV